MQPEVIYEEFKISIGHRPGRISVLEDVERIFILTDGELRAKHNLIDGNFVVSSKRNHSVTTEVISYRDLSHTIVVGMAPDPKKGYYPMVHSTREIENVDYTMKRMLYIKSLLYDLLGEIVDGSWQHVVNTIAEKAGLKTVFSALDNYFPEESLTQ